MKKCYSIVCKINGNVSTESTELNNDKRFSKKQFIEQVKRFRNTNNVEIISVKRLK